MVEGRRGCEGFIWEYSGQPSLELEQTLVLQSSSEERAQTLSQSRFVPVAYDERREARIEELESIEVSRTALTDSLGYDCDLCDGVMDYDNGAAPGSGIAWIVDANLHGLRKLK